MEVLSMEGEYQGGLSPLTRYGTLNVSTARIPRKKRSRGNIAPPRVTCKGYAQTDEGVALASEGIATVLVTFADGSSETRPVSSFRKGRESQGTKRRETKGVTIPEAARLASITEGQYS